jgi:serine phosphatase RsbU (regulator of sigma subunit)/Flp pilus assembly protein TadD
MKRVRSLLLFYSFSLTLLAQNKEVDSLQTLVSKAKEDTGKIALLNKLSACLRKKNNYGRATSYADEALLLSQKLGSQKGLALSCMNLGTISFGKADYKEALTYFQRAGTIFTALKDSSDIADALNGEGNVNYDQGSYPKALDCYFKSLKINEHRGSPSATSTSYENLAYVYKNQGDLKQALSYEQKALALRETLRDTFTIAASYNNMGITYKNLKDYSNALRCHEKALQLREKIGDKNGMGASYNNIGLVYKNQGDYKKAVEYQLLGLKYRIEGGDKNGVAISRCNLGSLYLTLSDTKKALDQFQQGLEEGEALSSKEIIKHCYSGLSNTYEKTGDLVKALLYNRKYSDIKDSIVNESNNKQIAGMKALFESDQKDHQIILLNKDKETQAAIATADSKRQKVIIGAVTLGLMLALVFVLFIWRSYRQKQKAHAEISAQKEIIEEKNKDITDSINYALRIQQAILPLDQKISKYLKEYFILFRPKDIVSGDFYWFQEKDGKIILAVVDCTGHGVPGAFMSLIGNDLLNEIVNGRSIHNPGHILQELNKGVHHALKQEETNSRDGMDLVICVLEGKRLAIAAANNPVWIYRKNKAQIEEITATKAAIGGHTPAEHLFETTLLDILPGDAVYLFSDGLADQFGGPKGKKFKYKQFKDLLLAAASQPLPEQKKNLEQAFDNWKGSQEQVDDVCVVGLRV